MVISKIPGELVKSQPKTNRQRYSYQNPNYVLKYGLFDCYICGLQVPLEQIEYNCSKNCDLCFECSKTLVNSKKRISRTKKIEICLVCVRPEQGKVQFQNLCSTCIDNYFRENGFLEKTNIVSNFEQFKYLKSTLNVHDLSSEATIDQDVKFIYARSLNIDYIKSAINFQILNTVGVQLEMAIHAYLVVRLGLRPGFGNSNDDGLLRIDKEAISLNGDP